VRLCLRRLGDSCNCISQRLLFYAAAPTARRHDYDEAEGGDTGEKLVIDLGMKDDCFALAHRLFKASQVLFEAVGDVSNAAMVRCNMSSLLRSQATLEMGRYTAISMKDGDASHAVYRVHLQQCLQHVKSAQKHCDSAVASFHRNGEGTSSRTEGEGAGMGLDPIRRTAVNNPIPRGSIRNTVALETAQTCLHLGTVLCCSAADCCTELCDTALYCIQVVPYRIVPYRTVPYRTVPYRTVPYRTVPYRTVPYRTVPYCTVLHSAGRQTELRYDALHCTQRGDMILTAL
jgi:hypothetical protein